jgi:hypothetical protein
MNCQACDSTDLRLILDLGFLPACNDFQKIGDQPRPTKTYPTQLFHCPACELVQLGYVPPPEETFPASYPYTSSTTKALRDNFGELAAQMAELRPLQPGDVMIDIGGNDGNLLSFFPEHCRRINVTPEDAGELSLAKGCEWVHRYWSADAGRWYGGDAGGRAKLITATNVFAHTPDPNDFLRGVTAALAPDGWFVSESTYLGATVAGQWDTCYSEHARYLSWNALRRLLANHGLSPFRSEHIDTHGGSVRVFACRSVELERLATAGMVEPWVSDDWIGNKLGQWQEEVRASRAAIRRTMADARSLGLTVGAVGAPSRGTTLLAYCGLTHEDICCVLETPASKKIGHYMPGTSIPVVDETTVTEWPDMLLILSHHVADAMKARMRELGFRGRFLIPLPKVRVE